MGTSILVIDDDVSTVETLQAILALDGYTVIPCTDPRSAQRLLHEHAPDLVLLDVMMPGLDGISLCLSIREHARREHARTPIIFLSAKFDPADRVIGLRVGADDYITKPYDADELLARIGSHLRRVRLTNDSPHAPCERFVYPGLELDDTVHAITVAGEPLDVTATEYRLLRVFLSRPNQVLSQKDLVDELHRQGVALQRHAIPVHLRRIRRKLEEVHGPADSITTVRGFGYRFSPPPLPTAPASRWR